MSEPLEIQCPGCQRKLRVPATAAGKRVRCPQCANVISVPGGGEITSTPKPPPPPPAMSRMPASSHIEEDDDRPRRPRADDDDDDEGPRRRSRDDDDDDDRPIRRGYDGSGLTALAICMIVFGFLGFCLDAFGSVTALVGPEPVIGQRQPGVDPAVQDMLDNFAKNSHGVFPAITQGIFGLMSIFMIIGGIQMIRRKTWGLCLGSSIISLINFGNCCCLAGIPLGIWGLILLSNKIVKDAFS